MAENKNNIIVYRDWISTFDSLSDDEAGKLIKHFFKYVNDMNPEAPDRLTMLLFEPIKQTLKRDLRKWEEYVDKQKVNGSMGGRPKANETQKTQAFFSKPKKGDSDSVSDIVKDKDIKEESLLSAKPTTLPDLKKKEDAFKSEVWQFTELYPEAMLNKFIAYWTEKNRSGKKMRYELEKTFEINRRLATWASRDSEMNKKDEQRPKAVLPTTPPVKDEVVEYFRKYGLTEEKANAFYAYYEAKGWKDKYGISVINQWKILAQRLTGQRTNSN